MYLDEDVKDAVLPLLSVLLKTQLNDLKIEVKK